MAERWPMIVMIGICQRNVDRHCELKTFEFELKFETTLRADSWKNDSEKREA